ncbi:MAG: hypothetical protein B6I24_04090 [Bacteroidetes bacterium 4572_128]|nr:MAG: hypothetical protein B6I24_04090 [Bacteroidetes bacterium 4572_128]
MKIMLAPLDNEVFFKKAFTIAYDYNFDRFLHYFLAAITQQQKRANTGYDIKKTVLAVIVLTQPYKIHNKTGMVLKF